MYTLYYMVDIAKTLTEQNIIQILGIENERDEVKKRVIGEAIEVIELRVFDRILKLLDEDTRARFITLLDQENEVGIAKVLQDNNIDSVAIVVEELGAFKTEMHNETVT